MYGNEVGHPNYKVGTESWHRETYVFVFMFVLSVAWSRGQVRSGGAEPSVHIKYLRREGYADT